VDTGGDYQIQLMAISQEGYFGIGSTSVHVTVPPPTATVTGLRVRPAPGNTTVPVSWDAPPADDSAWNNGVTHEYVVTVTGPDDAVIDAGSCTTVSSPSCEFSTDQPGDYTVEVALRTEAGTSDNTASDTAHLTLEAPSGQVGSVATAGTPGSGGVEVTWDGLADDQWSSGNDRSYTATIEGGLDLVENTCASVPAEQTSCYFVSDSSGPFTVTVTAVNEVGPAAAGGSADGTVILSPSVGVSDLRTTTAIDSPTVTVSWSRLTTGWEHGETRQYAVNITGPDGAEPADDGCSTEPVADDTDAPSCTFDVSVGGDYVVDVQPANEGGPGPAVEATAHVTLRPTAAVDGLTVGTEPGSPTVNVSWDRLPAAGWNGGSTHHYVVTVQTPAGAALDGNTCTTVDDDAKNPHCAFATDTLGDYTVQVAVANEAGTADTPATGAGTLAMGTPAAATAVSGVGGTNAITASWTAAVPTSLADVSSYTVSAVAKDDPAYPVKSCTGTVAASPCTIADVAAGVPYTVRVVTNGPGGSSAPADSPGTVMPAGAPKAPVEVPGNAVSAGTGTGRPGAPVTITGSGYRPYSTVVLSLFSAPESVGTTTADGNGDISVTVYLPPGTPAGGHTLLATGLDANGAVLNLAKSVAVTVNPPPVWTPAPVTTAPVTTPTPTTPAPTTSPAATPPTGAVVSLAARQAGPDDRSAVVTWAAGQVSWGDAAGRGYDVSVTGPRGAQITGSCTGMVAGTASSCEFDTDINGAYAVRVTAATDAGRSGQVAVTTVTVSTAPGAPTAVTGTPGANSISVSWKRPASFGAGIRGYTVTAIAPSYPARGCGPVTRSPCTIIGLAAGVHYEVRVVAVGPGGNSPAASSPGTITPNGTVQVPSDVPAGAVGNGSRVAGPGADVTITGTGFRPGTRVRAAIYPGGTSLTATTASAKGTASVHVTMPARGSYVVLAIGLDNGGRARYLATTLRARTPAAAVAGTPVKAQLVSGTPVVAHRAVTDTGTVGSTASPLAGTGTDSEPVVLVGFFMIMTGLLLTNIRTGPRRTARRRA
jgi:titin